MNKLSLVITILVFTCVSGVVHATGNHKKGGPDLYNKNVNTNVADANANANAAAAAVNKTNVGVDTRVNNDFDATNINKVNNVVAPHQRTTVKTGPQINKQDQTQNQSQQQKQNMENVGNNVGSSSSKSFSYSQGGTGGEGGQGGSADSSSNSSAVIGDTIATATAGDSVSSADGNFENIGNGDVTVDIDNPEFTPGYAHLPAVIPAMPQGDQVDLPQAAGATSYNKLLQAFERHLVDYTQVGPVKADNGLVVTLEVFDSKYLYVTAEKSTTDDCDDWDDAWYDCEDESTPIADGGGGSIFTRFDEFPVGTHKVKWIGAAAVNCSECASPLEMRLRGRKIVADALQSEEVIYPLYLPGTHVATSGSVYDGWNAGGSSGWSQLTNSLLQFGAGLHAGSGKTLPVLGTQGFAELYFVMDPDGVPVNFADFFINDHQTVAKKEVKQQPVVETVAKKPKTKVQKTTVPKGDIKPWATIVGYDCTNCTEYKARK